MEFDLKKPLYILILIIVAYSYVSSHYSRDDVLAYTKRKPSEMSPTIDYYVGMSYFSKGEYAPAVKAFQQLLTDYPTCQYAAAGLVRLGTAQEELRDWQGARETYEKYLEQFPGGRDRSLVTSKYELIKFK